MPPKSSVNQLVAIASIAVAGALAAGCGAACDPSPEANTPEVFSDGLTAGGVYETGAWSGPHLAFPGGKRWNLEHHLGSAPNRVSVYLAFFSPYNTELAPCAGNTCVFCVDDQYIWLRNDTCSDFYVRVVAEGALPGTPAHRCDDPSPVSVVDSGTDVASLESTSMSDALGEGAAADDGGDALSGAGDADPLSNDADLTDR